MDQPHTPDLTTTAPDALSIDQVNHAIDKARGALRRYRFMSLVTGTMLLILCVEMLIKYVLHWDSAVRYLSWIPFAHGWIYVAYLVTVFDLWSKMRWTWSRLIAMVLAGVVPVMSFLVERAVHRDADRELQLLSDQYVVAD